MENHEYFVLENNIKIKCNIFIKKDFLPFDQCNELIKYYDENQKASGIGFFDNRIIWYSTIPASASAKNIMRATRERTITFIKECYGLTHEMYGDSIQLVSWPEGLGMPPHYDNRHPNKNEPHPTPWREYAAVIYLNDDYEGGELTMGPLTIKPKKGMLVIFGGGDGYWHGVLPAYKNIRYTMPCWFTSDISKKESELSY